MRCSGELHLDHEQDLVVTCDMWLQALAVLPHAPATWDDGVDAGPRLRREMRRLLESRVFMRIG